MATPEKQAYTLPPDAVWFITGCSSGIGKSLATLISAHPTHRLVATARSLPSLSYLPSSPRILTLPLDVSSPSSISTALSATTSHFHRLDVLVNNAGYTIYGDAEATPDDLARRVMDTNFWSVVNTTKLALPIMRDVNPPSSGGVILNVSSLGGRVAYPGQAIYHASKFAMEGYIESVAKELRAEWNIHVCLLEPGGVQTNYATSSMVTLPPHEAYTAEDTPARVVGRYIADGKNRERWADADRIAEAVYGVVDARGERGIPLRVPLGGDAWGIIKMEHERVGRELDKGRELAIWAGKEGQFEALMGVS